MVHQECGVFKAKLHRVLTLNRVYRLRDIVHWMSSVPTKNKRSFVCRVGRVYCVYTNMVYCVLSLSSVRKWCTVVNSGFYMQACTTYLQQQTQTVSFRPLLDVKILETTPAGDSDEPSACLSAISSIFEDIENNRD